MSGDISPGTVETPDKASQWSSALILDGQMGLSPFEKLCSIPLAPSPESSMSVIRPRVASGQGGTNHHRTTCQASMSSGAQMAELWTQSVLIMWSLRCGTQEAVTAPKPADSWHPTQAVARTTEELGLGPAPHSHCSTLADANH